MANKVYEMPVVNVGDIVVWYPTGARSNDGLPAIVTRVNPWTICLSVFSLNSYNLLLRDGVRHVKDPTARATEFLENGAWDHTSEHRRQEELADRLVTLEALVQDVVTKP